ncbi:MAG TPA: acyl-CoA synthetase, partial [Alcaligenaceae bacterium]|nr:acyl-CoA synthetase [Alcaligenaceae bacterium]
MNAYTVHSAQVMNLGRLLTHTAKLYPGRPALITDDATWTWAQVNARVNAMVQALRKLGVRKGDKLLTQSRNNIQMFETCWVAFKLGCVWVPTNFRLTPPEVAYLGASSGASVMIVESIFHEHTDAVKAESDAIKHVISIGQPRAGEHDYEKLVAENLQAEDFEET